MMLGYVSSLLLLVGADESCALDNACVDGATSDTVSDVPYWGDVYTGNMYSGYASINKSCNSAMFYWMLEKEGGSEPGVTPVLLWLNGGPGASSIDGLLIENIGPYQIVGNNSFIYNEHRWTNKYNVLIIDNPVGTGYSYTDDKDECYCSTEKEVAIDFYKGLTTFFNLHSEYSTNPFWLVGESYAGKYIPHIASHLMDEKFPFEGVILGNGLYFPEKQYQWVPDLALNWGILDERTYRVKAAEADICVRLIQEGKHIAAGTFCEDMVGGIYDKLGGGVWEYDVRLFNDPTPEAFMTSYLNSAEVQSSLHTTGHTWTDADEEGPVADHLLADFTLSVMPELEKLLAGNHKVILYNGQMDGSVCNHVGNSKILELLKWTGQKEFTTIDPKLWRLDTENAIGFRRMYQNLAYVLIVNAGHLVPMTQPMNYRIFLDAAVAGELAQSRDH